MDAHVKIPHDMDVPSWRRDTTQVPNLLWLDRNLAVRNSKHSKFQETMDAINAALGRKPKHKKEQEAK